MILYNFFAKSTSAAAKKRGFNRIGAASGKGFVHIDEVIFTVLTFAYISVII